MLTKKELTLIKTQLESSFKPIYFFDDDPDGLCAFLLMYKYRKEGIGVPVKARSLLTMQFVNKAINYGADRIFVLDIPDADEEVLRLNSQITWIDHHETKMKINKNITYFNPLNRKSKSKIKKPNYFPTSYLCYKALNTNLWIAAVGCIGDYYLPDFMGEVKEKYPLLVGETNINNIDEIKYNSNLGKLVKMFSFLMMGDMRHVHENIKILTRIDDPIEILENNTSRSKKINKYFDKINIEYEKILSQALQTKVEDNILFFLYPSSNISVTKDLANELSSRMKGTVIIIGREKNGELKISLRWNKDIKTPFQNVLKNIDGYGGGHENSCGGAVKSEYKQKFLEQMKEEIKKVE